MARRAEDRSFGAHRTFGERPCGRGASQARPAQSPQLRPGDVPTLPKWAVMQEQQPETVAKVRKAHRALYDEGGDEMQRCNTCSERPRSVVFLACRHLSQCDDCYVQWANIKGWVNVSCPDCRKVSRVQHIDEYLSEHMLFVTTGGWAPKPPPAFVGRGNRHESQPTTRASPTNRRGRRTLTA
jgi:hypothetical protein